MMHLESQTQARVAVGLMESTGNVLAGKPEKPLKGRGHARVWFHFNRKMKAHKTAATFFDLLPDEHKTEVAYRRKGGWFGFERYISPEAAELWETINGEGAE